MQIVMVNPDGTASAESLEQACQVLEQGGIIGFPTDTLYGLGVDSSNPSAVEKLYQIKQRAKTPMSVMLDSVDALLGALKNVSPSVQKLIQDFLPGELTIVGYSDLTLVPGISVDGGKIGFRVPNHPLDLAIVHAFGRPVTSTSANISGYPSALNIETIIAYFSDTIDLLFDQGTLRYSPGSTVIDITRKPFHILREGAIGSPRLQPYLT